jgi:hypothetical protein
MRVMGGVKIGFSSTKLQTAVGRCVGFGVGFGVGLGVGCLEVNEH